MAQKKIFSVGYPFPGGEVEQFDFDSKQTLLDADIIVFEPTLGNYYAPSTYKGKPSLSEQSSFETQEALSHWRTELKAAFEAGKVIFVFLAEPIQVFIHTGKKEYSGTGRNRQTTNIVAPISSYTAIPLNLTINWTYARVICTAGDLNC